MTERRLMCIDAPFDFVAHLVHDCRRYGIQDTAARLEAILGEVPVQEKIYFKRECSEAIWFSASIEHVRLAHEALTESLKNRPPAEDLPTEAENWAMGIAERRFANRDLTEGLVRSRARCDDQH